MSNQFTISNGQISAKNYIKVKKDYTCSCGNSFELTLDWPEGLTSNGMVNVTSTCPKCNSPIVIPNGYHEVVDGKLISK